MLRNLRAAGYKSCREENSESAKLHFCLDLIGGLWEKDVIDSVPRQIDTPAVNRDSAAIRVSPAAEHDVPLILSFIRDLAEYERLADACVATEEALRRNLFGKNPAAEVLFAYSGDKPVGFALFFHNYSTFLAERGLYLEDLFVIPEARGQGAGYALLSALAEIALSRNCVRMEWAVLAWNQLAIDFYHRLGATPLDDWRTYRLIGEPLRRLAGRT
jgi:GNAT superfamily N-acetyltransferase